MRNNIHATIADQFNFMFEDALIAEMAAVGELKKVKAGDVLIEIGSEFQFMPLLLEGAIKIMKEDKSENELLLYYLESGDTCAMSMSCCLGKKVSKIRAVAEEDSLLVLIPIHSMTNWLCKYPTWQSYVFDSMQVRMDEFLEAIEMIAFMKLDERLLKYLRDKAKVLGSMTIHTTHREIASDMHTSRVVVSRLLKQMETAGLIKVGRSEIELVSLN